MVTALDVLVLPAFDDLPGVPGEAEPWREAYEFTEALSVPGLQESLLVSDSGLGLVPTGIGKTAAATTVTALFASDGIDLEDALVLSVGVAGAPPALPVGSVVIAETIVDWDDKCRFDPEDRQAQPDDALAVNPYTEGDGVFDLNDDLVTRALDRAEECRLVQPGQENGPSVGPDTEANSPAQTDTEANPPAVTTGTNLCGDELWHGKRLAEQAQWRCRQHDVSPYRVTEMEDAGTARALERFDALERYLSIRGVSNHDRPVDGKSARESFFDPTFEDGFEAGLQNAVRVGQRLVDEEVR